MIYIATLNRNGVVKIGRSKNPLVREKKLRSELDASGLKMIRAVRVPYGWGTDAEWESELLKRVRKESGHLQLFAESEQSTEVADCTIEEANAILDTMCRRTEINPDKDAPDHDEEKVDWRFYYPTSGRSEYVNVSNYWRSLCHRQEFINLLRGNKWALIPRAYFEIDIKHHRDGLCPFPATPIMRFQDNGVPWILDF